MIRRRFLAAGTVALALLVIPPAAIVAASTRSARATFVSAVTYLNGVTCLTSAQCWAVGSERSINSGLYVPLIQRWDGNSWVSESSPALAGLSAGLLGITCASASECWAVGGESTVAGASGGFIERWDGLAWTLVTPFAPSALASVTCVSTADCWAVGETPPAAPGDSASGVIENWNGSTWSVIASQAQGIPWLEGVACVSSTNCWASGSGFEHWNGAAWTLVPVFETGPFSSVACASLTECWAVESRYHVIERWNGTSWTGITLADGNLQLSGVTCVAAAECWAVGTDYFGQTSKTAVERWNGTTWAPVASPDPIPYGSIGSGYGDGLSAVTCITTSTCIAIGSNVAGLLAGVHETWNGTWWTATLQQDTPGVVYDRWEAVVDQSASGGTLRESEIAGETASFRFSGTAITWLAEASGSHGIAAVTIDGVNKGDIDLFRASTPGVAVSNTFAGLAPGPHTIVITVTGTKNPASSGVVVDIDAFQVGTSITQDSSPQLTYDSWTGSTSAPASGGSYRSSSEPRAVAKFTYTGTGVDWITATGPAGGMARVTVDGSLVAIVDLYSATAASQVVESYQGLAPGSHTLAVTLVGSKNPLSTGHEVVIDAFVIHE
jgi:hypothetical protein